MSAATSGETRERRGLGSRILLFARTVSHLKVRQIVVRVARMLARPHPDLRGAPPRRSITARGVPEFLPRRTSYLGGGSYRLLNRQRHVPDQSLPLRNFEHLWDYEVHYFSGLFGSQPDEEEKWRWIEGWIRAVPPGSRPAWDPYPTSRRIVNWIKWAVVQGGSPQIVLDNLAAQIRYLAGTLEHHVMANHLLANAVALTMAGAYFDGEEGDAWLARGCRLLDAELREQFLADGAHFELSPVYHALIVEDLLDLIQVGRTTGVDLPPRLHTTASGALTWLRKIMRPDGRLPLFNDGAYGVAAAPSALLDYGHLLGVRPPDRPMVGLERLAPSGYVRYESDSLFMIADIGGAAPAYQPGHTHCDMLSFELCWKGLPVVVDTGTSTYEIGPRRATERGTAAHNTIQAGSLEQSEIWAGFRIARRARVLSVSLTDESVVARIRAFPPAWPHVERSWTGRGESIEIVDRVVRDVGVGPWTSRFHFHPEVALSGHGCAWQAGGLRIGFEGASGVREEEYQYAPEFNRLVPARRLVVEFTDRLATVLGP